MKSLTQKKLFTTSLFEIREKGLFVSIHSISERFEEEILFEDISNRNNRLTKKEPFLAVLSSGFVVASILTLIKGSIIGFGILIGIAIFFWLMMKISNKDVIQVYLHNEKALVINADKPDKESVDRFLDTLKKNKRDYLIAKYATIDKDLPIEGQLNNLVWLKNSDYLDEAEFINYKNKLLGRENESKIGFHKEA
jgi:hypothetical protein